MRKLIIIASLFLLSALTHTKAQSGIAFWTSGGLSSSRMDDMKYLQEYILTTFPYEGKSISAFPPYILAGVGFTKQFYPSLRVGAGYYHSTSGSRSNYSDYSGYLTSEMNASSNRLGVNAAYVITGNNLIELSLTGRLEANYTRLDIQTTVQVFQFTDLHTNNYHSLSPGGAAGGELMFHLNSISLGLEGGYEVNIPGKLKKRKEKTELLDPSDRHRQLTSDWTGWYAQLKVMFWLD